MSCLVLIVDDDPVQRRLLETLVRRFGYETESVESGAGALARLEPSAGRDVDLLILDLVMPELDGMTVLERMREQRRSIPTIVQTAHGSIETVISAMRAGAIDFVVKPVGAERLQVSIKNALRVDALEDEVRRLNRQASGTLTFKDLASKSADMERVIRLGERAAKSTIPVLLEGELGVGKEVIARAIQGASDRRGKPFITVNCGALPENLVESILFGHEKGAFTGADREAPRQIRRGATAARCFSTKSANCRRRRRSSCCARLQDGEIDPVGAKRPVKVDIRLISATNQDLIELVKRGAFREDLYYRLNVFPITIPALRVAARGHCRSRPPFCRAVCGRGRQARARHQRRGARRCSAATNGRAMCGNWRMRSSAPWCSPTATN